MVGIRLESAAERRMLKLIGGAVAVSVTLYLAAVNLNRVGEMRQRNSIHVDRSFSDLTANDDLTSVIAKLGPPAGDRWQAGSGPVRYRALSYPARHCTVILMAGPGNTGRYLGTVDNNWRIIHAAPSPNGASAELLRSLKQF